MITAYQIEVVLPYGQTRHLSDEDVDSQEVEVEDDDGDGDNDDDKDDDDDEVPEIEK